jgi:hypothetical protein
VTTRFDVAARLAEGRPAVEHTQTYVRACHVLGYQHPDLTAYGSQVSDWYETEAGLDLRVLDDDSAELAAAVNVIEEALHLQRAQLAELMAAWQGSGADSAMWFLQHHCEAATAVAANAHAAAEGCAALRDNLWEIVDRKVATAIAIDDRTLGERPEWLAAAHTVMAGAGDRSAAEGLVRQQVNPYVDNDIRTDWVTAMHSAVVSVATSYEVIIHALMSAPEVCFETPGELGPSWQPVPYEPFGRILATRIVQEAPLPAGAVPTTPAAASASLPPTTAAPPTLPAGTSEDLSPIPAELAAPLGDAAGLSTGAGNLGGLGGLAGGLGGVVGKIADGIGGLLGSLADGFAGPSGFGDPVLDGALDVDDPLAGEAATDDGPDDMGVPPTCGGGAAELADTDKNATCDRLGENASAADDATDAAQQVTAPPVDTPPPAGASPPDDPTTFVPPPDGTSPPDDLTAFAPPADEATPCEIAADALPQAGPFD